MPLRRPLLYTLVAVSCTQISPLGAEVYRFTAPDGSVVFSQTRPPEVSESSAEKVRIAPGPSAADQAAAHARLRGRIEAEFDEKVDQEQKAEEKAEKEPTPEEAAKRKKQCAEDKRNLATIEGLNKNATSVTMPDGVISSITPSRRAEYTAAMRKRIKENCSGK